MEMKFENELKIAENAVIFIKRIAIDISKSGLINQQSVFEFGIDVKKVIASDRKGKLNVKRISSRKISVLLRNTPKSAKVYGLTLKMLLEPEIHQIGNIKVIEWPALDLFRISTNVKPYQILGFKSLHKLNNEEYWVAERNVTNKIKAHVASKRSSRIELIGNSSMPVFLLRGKLRIDCTSGGRISVINLNRPQHSNRHQVVQTSNHEYNNVKEANNNLRIEIDHPCSPGETKEILFNWEVKLNKIPFYQEKFAYPSMKAYNLFRNDEYSHLYSGNKYWNINDPDIQNVANATRNFESVWQVHRFLFEFVNRRISYQANGIRYSSSHAFKTKIGDCSEYADLLITLHRLSGIPSRLVEGMIVDNNKLEGHAWLEFLTPNGWIPSDPTWGIPIGVSSQHISFQRQMNEKNPTAFSFSSSGPKPKVTWDISFIGIK